MTTAEYSEQIRLYKNELAEKIRLKTQDDINEFQQKAGVLIRSISYDLLSELMDSGAIVNLGHTVTIHTELE